MSKKFEYRVAKDQSLIDAEKVVEQPPVNRNQDINIVLSQCHVLADLKYKINSNCPMKNYESYDTFFLKQQNKVCMNIINRIDDMINSLFDTKH